MKFLSFSLPALAVAAAEVCHMYSDTIESPCSEVVSERGGYFVREYGKQMTAWTDAKIDGESFADAEEEGFQKNFDYISGKNSDSETIPMTSPVIFRKLNGEWYVSFFVPSSFDNMDKIPTPNDDSVSITAFPSGSIRFAVVKFGGFAGEKDFAKQTASLKAMLKADGVETAGDDDEWEVVWAGYDSPFVLFNRHNEVLIRLVEKEQTKGPSFGHLFKMA